MIPRVLVLFVIYIIGLVSEWSFAQEVSNEQNLIVYSKWENSRLFIYVSNADSSNERLLVEGSFPDFFPTQKKIAFVRSTNLYVINVDGTNEVELLNNDEYTEIFGDGGVRDPFWSPDGQTIYFNWSSGVGADLIAINADGTNPRVILKSYFLSSSSWPSPFSPDGRYMLVSNGFGISSNLTVYDIATEQLLGSLTEASSTGSWSPDGQHIAFRDDFRPGLFVIRRDGSLLTDLLEQIHTNNIQDQFAPGSTLTWSPDGQRLAFTDDNTQVIYAVKLDGTNLQVIETHFPKWTSTDSRPTPILPATWGSIKNAIH